MADQWAINPITKRRIKVGGNLYNELVRMGKIVPVAVVASSGDLQTYQDTSNVSTATTPAKKTTNVSPSPKQAIKLPNAELVVKKRDPALYTAFKRYLKDVPDTRRFETIAMKKAMGLWNNAAKWQELLDELQQLDALAVPNAKESNQQNDDVRLVEWMNALDPENYEVRLIRHEPTGDMLARVWNSDRSDYYNVAGFVLRYPVLAWLMTRINPHFRLHALRAHPPYLDWIEGTTFQWREPEEYAPYVTDERLLGVLLGDIELRNYKDYPLGDHMRIVSERKNIAYLRYVVNRVAPHSGLLYYFVRAGDVETVKLAIIRMSPQDQSLIKHEYGKHEISHAIASGNVSMLQFIEKEFAVKAIEKEFYDQFNDLIHNGSFEMIIEMKRRGYPIRLEDLIYAVQYGGNGHPLTVNMLIYLIKEGEFTAKDIFKRIRSSYPRAKRIMQDQSVFIVSTGSPIAVMRYILDTYGKDATEADWNDLLTYYGEGFYGSPDEDEQHVALLFSVHQYSEEQKEGWRQLIQREET